MNISGMIKDLQDASSKLSDISSDVANMVIIDGSINSTRDMNDKLHEIKNQIMSVSRVIEANKQIIQNCCEELGISVNFYSGSGGGDSHTPHMGGANTRSNVSYEKF